MLGTPNGGSHAIPELLVGQSVLLSKLARLDVRQRPDRRCSSVIGAVSRRACDAARRRTSENQFSARPGGPSTPDRRRRTGSLPDEAGLRQAREIRRADGQLADRSRAHDLCRRVFRRDGRGRCASNSGLARAAIASCFMGTTRGDGRVTWESGIPASLPALLHGRAARRSRRRRIHVSGDRGTAPAWRDAAAAADAAGRPVRPSLCSRCRARRTTGIPDEDDLAAAVVGAGTRAQAVQPAPERPVRVRVVHGNLAFAQPFRSRSATIAATRSSAPRSTSIARCSSR